jgi:squalene-hopene/tetraprenyl-beta-curcumene cyclase
MTRAELLALTGADPAVALDRAIERARSYLLCHQYPEGYWWAELESNVTITAEYLLLTHFLGAWDPERARRIANYLRQQQRDDGAWAIYYGGPADLNTTIEAYFALKLAGHSPEEPYMRRAREFVLSRGGIGRSRVFTRVWLALFGQYDWRALPVMPPEVMFLPSWFPFNIYAFACWARETIVPLLVVMTLKPDCPLPPGAGVDELYCDLADRRRAAFRSDPPLAGPFTWRNFFLAADRALRLLERSPWKPTRRAALRRAERWIVAHQEADGSWGGIQPPWVYSLIALHCLGYGLDHPVMSRGLRGFEGFAVEEGDAFHIQSCVSPVWDTALAAIALLDSGLRPDHPALQQAARWLLKEQVLTGGDWQVKVRGVEPGGWAFEFENDLYPDTDDTAEAVMALRRIRPPSAEGGEEAEVQKAIERGVRWLLAMQSKNGGWGAFDVDNTRRFVTRIPFADFGETIDPPSEDVTSHVVELLGLLGRDDGSIRLALGRALAYLRRTQEPDGAWFGRWGVNYVYGTGAVLPALHAAGEDMSQAYVQRAADWLEAHQNPDGGWGETCASYDDPALRGRGPSTASQTAWALLGLLAARPDSPAIHAGAGFLLRTQTEDGDWEEPYFTGTGFPRDFMLKYHFYRVYFPLTALGRYRGFLRDNGRKGG